MECANCGTIGHTFRDCKEPVMSYGICAIKIVDGVPQYLLIRRRDSISYVEFLRGKYKMDNREYIQLLINGMTVEERGRLLSQPFDRLWETLWNSQNTRQFRNECEAARRCFEALKNTGDTYGRLLVRYIEDASTAWTDAEWGFPKGRRSVHEKEIDCALREYGEETGLNPKLLHLVDGESPLVEEYTGTNGIRYKQIYFVAAVGADSVAVMAAGNRVMNREVGNIGYFSFDDALAKIRPTNGEKRALLERLHHKITTTDLKDRLVAALEWSHT